MQLNLRNARIGKREEFYQRSIDGSIDNVSNDQKYATGVKSKQKKILHDLVSLKWLNGYKVYLNFIQGLHSN